MVININYRKIFIVCVVLTIFLGLTAVSASDINETADTLTDDAQLSASDSDGLGGCSTSSVVKTSYKAPGSVFIKGSSFDFQLLDSKGKGIAGKVVKITYKNHTYNRTTDSNGHVYLKLSSKGIFDVNFAFDEEGYAPLNVSKTVTVINNQISKISAYSYVAYVGVRNPYTVTLSAGGVNLAHKKVTFVLKGKKYTATTNLYGKATLNIDLPKGTYTVKCYFDGVKNVKASSASAKITVKKGMPTTLVRMSSNTYVNQVSTPFVIKLKDSRQKPIANKTIVFKINGKTYSKKTDDGGLATLYIKLPTGSYKLTVSSYSSSVYKRSSNTYTIKVKSDGLKNNGFWLFGSDMKKVNLTTMAKNGVNQIFLNAYAVELHGKKAVSNFATQAASLGIKVHIWMQVFNDGDWISPVYNDGSFKYSLFNSIIKEAKGYASIEGVAGIHFDYLRFPGTAYKYTNGVKAINYFTKTACEELHNLNKSLIVSAAVMPEPSSNKYYYGQEISTLSQYLDVIVPMVYKGNYGKSASWIKSVTAEFVKQSQGAEIWTGLQGYYSDSNVAKLPKSTLINDADYAGMGGASGVIIFRYSLFNLINFNNL